MSAFRHFLLFILLAGFGTFFSVRGDAPYTTLANFGDSGAGDYSSVVAGNDGNFYATMQGGAILQITPAGVVTTLHLLSYYEGQVPNGLTLGTDGNFYGTASSGGAFSYGTIFKVSPAGTVTTLVNFNGTNGNQPTAALISGGNGYFYGTTAFGGTSNAGTIFAVDPTGNLTTLYSFSGSAGHQPLASLLLASDGNFYGSTSFGGTFNYGTIFKITPAGALTTLVSFSGTNGAGTVSNLIQATDGNFYGTTRTGGLYNDGTVFKMTPAGVLTTLVHFDGNNGLYPQAGLVQGSDGALYGTTFGVTSGGNFGNIFQVTLGGALTVLKTFNSSNGANPECTLIQSTDGSFYGTTCKGGSSFYGSFFKIGRPTGILPLITFKGTNGANPDGGLVMDSAGNLYGTTFYGGSSNYGTLFKLNPGGNHTPVYQSPSAGGYLSGDLLLASDGSIYGTTLGSGSTPNGTIYKYTPGGSMNFIGFFNGTNGANPHAGLIQGSDGSFYGTTSVGGASSYGTICRWTSGVGLSALASFDYSIKGAYPETELIQASDGNFYGTTTAGGGGGKGTLFQVTPAGVLNQVVTFTGPTGSSPYGGLVQANDGFIYGCTQDGGLGYGTLFRLSTAGSFSIAHTFTSTEGGSPSGTLMQGKDGRLYGTTDSGGASGSGIVFAVTLGGTLTVLDSFTSGTTGSGSRGKLIQGSDGSFYGTCYSGGAQSQGTVFKLFPPVLSQTISFSAPSTIALSSTPFTLFGSSTSGLPLSYKVSGPATVSGNTLTFTGVGQVTVQAYQLGNATYAAAVPVTKNIAVTMGSQTITFPQVADGYAGDAVTLAATASSGLPVSYSIVSGAATLSGNTLTATGDTFVVVAANQAGDANYNPAQQVTIGFHVARRSQTITPFAVIPDKTYGAAPFTITLPTSNSGLPVTVMVASGPATLSGNTVTITGTGGVTLVATQTGNAYYQPAQAVNIGFGVMPASQTVTPFSPIPDQTYGVAPFDITLPTADSGQSVSVSVQSGPATLTGHTLTVTGVGDVVLAAFAPGSANYLPSPQVTATFTVKKASQTIAAFAPIADVTYGTAPFSVPVPTASSGLPVALRVVSGPVTLDGNTVTITGTGPVVLAASQPGSATYEAAPDVTVGFTVHTAGQTISPFAAIPDQVYGVSPFNVATPTASSGLPVVLSVISGPATLASNTVTITGTGTVVLGAAQSGNGNFDAAPSITTTFTVNPAGQTISPFAAIPNQVYGVAPFDVTLPTASSGLPVALSVISGPATLASNTLTITGTGSVVLGASQAGNGNFNAAPSITTTFTVNQAGQQIGAFAAIADQVYGVAPFSVAVPVSTSGLPVGLSVLSGPATVSGNTVTLNGTGSVVLAANQAGDTNYTAAAQVTIGFAVNPATQTIVFTPISSPANGSTFTAVATASSGLPVTFAVLSGPATVAGDQVTITSGVGTVKLQANQAGNELYRPASVTQTFSVTKIPQTISFPAITNPPYGVLLAPGATSSSGLSVTYSVVSGPATISGNKVSFTGVGHVTIQGNQVGNGTYAAAPAVTASFTVVKGSQTITLPKIANQSVDAEPITLKGTASSGLPVTYRATGPATLSGNVLTITGAGSVAVGCYQSGNALYAAAPNVQISFAVKKLSQTVTFTSPGPQAVGHTITLGATSTSGLPITYTTTTSSLATISGNTVTFTGKGTAKITATQPGDNTYAAARTVAVNILVK